MKWAQNAILNLPGHHSVAAISAELRFTPGKDTHYTAGELRLSDCSRVVCLDLDAELDKDSIERSLEQLENTQHKIDTLVRVTKELQKQFKIQKKEAIAWLNS